MSTWQEDVARAIDYHGHLCGGQIFGVRMSRLGLQLLNLKQGEDLRDLVIFLESDRCVADAAYVVTGVTLGKRRIKMNDYGKTAMSFFDINTGKGYRIHLKTEERPDEDVDLVAFWEKFSDEELFDWEEVAISLSPMDLPGSPARVVNCEKCGEKVLDGRDVQKDGRTLCKACSYRAYYMPLKPLQELEEQVQKKGKSCCGSKKSTGISCHAPKFPDTSTSPKWAIYDTLLASVSKDAKVTKCAMGPHWVLIEADSGGIGVAQNFPIEGRIFSKPDVVGQSLFQVASLLKSWNFHEAAIGMAALNAANNTALLIKDTPLHKAAEEAKGDAFDFFMPKIKGKKVAVIGHFPGMNILSSNCELTILERKLIPGDMPDTAAEYVLPLQDVVLMTGTTLINKSMPRLLELSQNAFVCIVGPSTPMDPKLFELGVDSLSGLVVMDSDAIIQAITSGACEKIFEKGGVKVNLERQV